MESVDRCSHTGARPKHIIYMMIEGIVFPKFTGLAIDTVGGDFESDGGAVGRRREADRSCSAVTDRNYGVHLCVIWQFCTKLLIVFPNNEVTLLAGLMSYSSL